MSVPKQDSQASFFDATFLAKNLFSEHHDHLQRRRRAMQTEKRPYCTVDERRD